MVMRKILFGLLLVTAAAPALAAGGPNDRDDNDRPQRHQAQVDRSDRNDRGNRDQPQRPANVERPQFNGGQNRPDFQRPQANGGDWQRGRAMQHYGDAPDSVRNWRPQQNNYVRQQMRDQAVNGERAYGQRYDGQRYDGQRRYGQGYGGAYTQRGYGQQQGYVGSYDRSRHDTRSPFRADSRRDDRVRWDRDWRNDRRWDWRDRRYRDRSRFHLSLYIDPFGWGYQPYSIGYDLQPSYYQQNYWIDPAMYGLPYPPPGAQWVRYWNDAVLVDMYSGQVIDSIQGFFW
jgi:Ni/Co efflux regulator RcnB